MYFKSIEIENTGPIDWLRLDFPFEGERPKPIVIVGENGTGKSILLAHLVNTLITGKQEHFDDNEVEQGKVYKYRSPTYITSGKNYSYSSVKFTTGIEVQECQLQIQKKDFEEQFGYAPIKPMWRQIPPNETSAFRSTFANHADVASKFFKEECCLYFPVNRFEEPAWLNIDNLKLKANYSDLKLISRYSNRAIISTSPLKKNKDWLLDIIFDRQAFDLKIIPINSILPTALNQPLIPVNIFGGFSGQSASLYDAILRVLKIILRESGNIRLGAGTRKNRQISVMKDEQSWVPNLFQLSSGEIQLLNLFLSIVRDYDLSESNLNSLTDIKGIVIIDEIDSNLHTTHQKEVLPELIALFPNVQFVITTHSPLFLMGMEEKLGNDQFTIVNMPNGEQLAAADFSEFKAAYDAFRETTRHREEIRLELERNSRPIVFVEGEYDVRYIRKAAELHNKVNLLDSIQLENGDGFGNLDKIWRGYDNPMSAAISNKIILLYDCDTKKRDESKGQIFKRVIPSLMNGPITIGIENLFAAETVERVEALHPHYIDNFTESTKRIRGVESVCPASKSVNKDEKGNLCNWLCENGSAEDFQAFESIFRIIEEIITP